MRFIQQIIEKIYRFLLLESIAPYALKIDFFLEKHFKKLYEITIGKEKKRINFGVKLEDEIINENSSDFSNLIWRYEKKLEGDFNPKVSVIVPNYNHALYLRERLDSIYSQTYSNYEVILLDDCSSDNSKDILQEYANKYKDNTIVEFNENNIGKPFMQWNKGLALASGDLVWIAESDDYSEEKFLEKMVSFFRYESLMIAFSRSDFVTDGNVTWTTEKYLHDLQVFQWGRPFIMTAADIVKHGFAYKNMIPNVSSAVFRNIKRVPKEVENIWTNLDLCGDWIFYLCIMKGASVGYTNEVTNYYRVHNESTSLKIQHRLRYYEEQEIVSRFIARNYEVEAGTFESILESLKQHYQAINRTDQDKIVETYYRVDEIYGDTKLRLPNILMGCYGLIPGGGETYPLYLANEMKKQNISVTVVNFNMGGREENIRKILNVDVPLVTVESLDYFAHIILRLNAEIIHSHHGSVDMAIASWFLNSCFKCKQFITLHGMYEAIDKYNQKRLIDAVSKSCAHFAYIADKNIEPFLKSNAYDEEKFTKFDNGLPILNIRSIDRGELGIEQEAFVLCLASRALPEKGWEEGIQAVKEARKKCSRPIHLIILGDGDIRKKLEDSSPEYIHFMGIKNNVRDYFNMSDVGFLPSRFRGESYPLVVCESILCNRPVIATDIAEVKNQLKDKHGELAGRLVKIDNWIIDMNDLVDAIVELADNKELYGELKARTWSAGEKFNITNVVHKYLYYYQQCVKECK